MGRIVRAISAVGVSLLLLIFSAPAALADGCPDTEIARILCPGPAGHIFVCQDDHSGLITVHHHCRFL